jgi:hypothetical protein
MNWLPGDEPIPGGNPPLRPLSIYAELDYERRCYWDGCVATWKHWHGFLPGGYDDPADPEGVPISFTEPAPDLPPGWCRDYNGAPLPPKAFVPWLNTPDREDEDTPWPDDEVPE